MWDGPAQLSPSSANSVITVRSGHTITVNGNENADQVILEAGGKITINGGRTLTIVNGPGTDLNSSGILDLQGTLLINAGADTAIQSGGILLNEGTVTTTGTLTFSSGGKYQHNFTTTAGTVPTATWSPGSTCEIIGYTSNTTMPAGLGQAFANFTWNCTNQTSSVSLGGTLNTVNENLTILSTGTGTGDLFLGRTAAGNLSVGGNFSQTAGIFIITRDPLRTLTVAGNFSLSGGLFNLSSGAGTGQLNVAGNFSHTSGTTITETSTSPGTIFFNGTNIQTYTSGGTVINTVNFSVNNGSTLDMGTSLVGNGSTGNFTNQAGSTLRIGSATGIATSGATGNVRVSGTRNFATGANYTYNGSAAQITGNGLPATVNNLTINNSAGVSLTAAATVNGVLTLTSGSLVTGGNQFNLGATASISGGSAASYVNGNLQKTFSIGTQTFTFPIGDNSSYTPLALVNLSVTASGGLRTTTTAGNHPQSATGGINTSQNVNRFWTLTQSGGTFGTYDATFNYPAADVDVSATPSNFRVRRWNGSAWSASTVSGTPTITSASISSQTGFGDFAIGNQVPTNQTITFPSPGAQTYGVAPITLGATASSGLTVSYTVTSGPATVLGNTLTITGAGSVTIQAAQAGDADWNPASPVSQTISVAQKTVTPSITANNKSYDGTTAATIATRSLTGVINADVVNLTGGTATFANKNVGNNKAVTATGLSLSGAQAGNYVLSSTTAASLLVSATGVNKVYDGTTSATVTLSDNRVAGDVLTTSHTGASFTDKNVGNGKAVNVTGIAISGADAGNYTANAIAATTADITTATLLVGATGVNKVYDGTTSATVTLSDNRVAGDVLTTSHTGASFADKNVGNGKTVNVTGIAITGTDAGNYSANTTASATADITAASLLVSATGVNKVYDATTSATVTLSDNRVAGDVLATSHTGANFTDKNVGNGKTINVTGIAISGADAGNYTANATAATTADITTATLLVGATGVNKVYDATTIATVTLSDNRMAGDVLTTSHTGASFANKNVGLGKTINVTGIAISGSDAGNYTANTTATATANITAATLLISATGVNKVYDGTTSATVTLSDNRVASDVLTTSHTGASFADKNVGNGKTINVMGIAISGAEAGNYSANITATANITAAILTVRADDKYRTFGTTNPVLTASFLGFVSGEGTNVLSGSPVLSTVAIASSPVGRYPIVISPGTLSAANYSFSLTNGTLRVIEIRPALTIKLVVGQPNQVVLQSLGLIAGGTYRILASTDFIQWTEIGSVQAEPDGTIAFIISNILQNPMRFYRTSSDN